MIMNIHSTYMLSTTTPLSNAIKISDQTIEDSREKFATKELSSIKIESSEDAAIKKKIEELKAYEQMVVAHEHKHMATGGGIASSPSYTYTYGPDGKKYISGGNVSMRVPKSSNAEDMIENLKKVQTAALAPSNPSPQDLQTAALARARETSIENEYKVKQAKERYEKQAEIGKEIKASKLKNLDVLDRMIEKSY